MYIAIYNQSCLCRVALRFCTKHAVIEAQWPEAFSYSTAATGLGLALGYVLGGVHWSPRPLAVSLGKRWKRLVVLWEYGEDMGNMWLFFWSLSWNRWISRTFGNGVGGNDRNPRRWHVCIQLLFGNVSLGMQPYMIQLGVKRCDTDWPVISLWTKHQVFFGIHCAGLTPNSWRKTAWNWSFPVFGRRYQGINFPPC